MWSSEDKKKALSNLSDLTEDQLLLLKYDWGLWARPNQMPPEGNWYVWMQLAGRGNGKTRSGAEWCIDKAMHNPKAVIALCARNNSEMAVMISQGIMSYAPPWFKPKMTAATDVTVGKRILMFPNGAIGIPLSAENEEDGRGWNFTHAWLDELAAFKRIGVYDNIIMALRAGKHPQMVITTTPKPIAKVKQLIAEAETNSGVILTRGTTFENRKNIPDFVLQQWLKKYEGTSLGRQELYAEIVENSGALWKYDWIERNRIKLLNNQHRLDLINNCKTMVVSVDPAITAHADSNKTGIVVHGLTGGNRALVFEDLSAIYTPEEWAGEAINAYRRYNADIIVAEVNQGGDMVESMIKAIDRNIPYKGVRALRGKYIRAEPIAQLYKEDKVSHVGTELSDLEHQLTEWIPGDDSPDNMDALVWGLTHTMIETEPKPKAGVIYV